MNYPKNIKRYIKDIGMVEIRPYLTTSDIDAILEKIQIVTTDYALRKMMMYSIVMSICTDINTFKEEEVSLGTIEVYYLNKTFDRIVKYIKGFDTLIDGFESLAVLDVYKRFENALESFTTQFKNIDVEKSMNDFENKLSEFKQLKEKN